MTSYSKRLRLSLALMEGAAERGGIIVLTKRFRGASRIALRNRLLVPSASWVPGWGKVYKTRVHNAHLTKEGWRAVCRHFPKHIPTFRRFFPASGALPKSA